MEQYSGVKILMGDLNAESDSGIVRYYIQIVSTNQMNPLLFLLVFTVYAITGQCYVQCVNNNRNHNSAQS